MNDDAAKIRKTPGRRPGLSSGTWCAGFLLVLVALVWVFAHYRHVGYRTEFKELMPMLLFAAGVVIVCCVGGLYLRQRPKHVADREVSSEPTVGERRP